MVVCQGKEIDLRQVVDVHTHTHGGRYVAKEEYQEENDEEMESGRCAPCCMLSHQHCQKGVYNGI